MVTERSPCPSGDRWSFCAVCWGTGRKAGPAEPQARAPCWTADDGRIWARIRRRPAGSLRLGPRLPRCTGWRAEISVPAWRRRPGTFRERENIQGLASLWMTQLAVDIPIELCNPSRFQGLCARVAWVLNEVLIFKTIYWSTDVLRKQ